MNKHFFKEIKTERLHLRRIEETDGEAILFLRSDKTINKFIERPENRKTKNIADAINFIKELDTETKNHKSVSWGITLINNPEIIGTICLWNFSDDNKTAEIGYDLNPLFQQKGIMTEALIRVVNFGLNNLNFEKIEAFTHIKNERSKNLLERNGFYFNERRKDIDNLSNVIFEIKKPIDLN